MTTRLPLGAEAILDIRKIEDYCLNPTHPRGPGRRRRLRNSVARRCRGHATGKERCGKITLDRADRREGAEVHHLLGVMMQAKDRSNTEGPSLFDVVALLTDVPAQRLTRGQVGTIVEHLDRNTSLVEFSDDQGRAYAVAPCRREDLLVLHYVPEAA